MCIISVGKPSLFLSPRGNQSHVETWGKWKYAPTNPWLTMRWYGRGWGWKSNIGPFHELMRGVRAGLYYCSGWCSVPMEWAVPIYQEPGLNLASSPIYHNTSTNLFGKWEWSALSNAYLSPPICKLYRFTMHSLLQGHSFWKNMNIRGNPKTSRPDIYKRVQCGIIYQFVSSL